MTLTRNALSTAGQTIVGAIILFALYRQVVAVLGAERLGVWSIVLATVSASRVGEFGLSAGVTRFVAKYRAGQDAHGASSVIQTAAITATTLLTIAAAVAYPLLSVLFRHLFPAGIVDEAIALLPVALASLLLTVLAAVFQAGLDACHRYDQRAAVVIATQLAFLALAYWLMPRFGLLGLAWAQAVQGSLQVLASWLLLRRLMPALPLLPYQWNPATLRGMLSFGLQFQIGSLAQLLFEPLTKALMGKFGGLAVTGYYEMARQLVGRIHQLFASANQIIVPMAAELKEQNPQAIASMYRKAIQLVFIAALMLFSLVAAWAPLLSEVWLGEANHYFIVFTTVLAASLGVNALTGPAYFSNIGTGALTWNTTALLAMGAINGALGVTLGPAFGAFGVLAASTAAITVGSLIPILAFQHRYQIPMASMLPHQTLLALVSCVAAPVLSHLLFSELADKSVVGRYALCVSLPLVLVGLTGWHDPHARNLVRKVLGRNGQDEAAA